MDRPDLLSSVKELVRKMASPSAKDLIALKRVARYTIKYSRMACRYLWILWIVILKSTATRTLLDVFLREKSTVGGTVVWSGQFVKAWSKTMGVLALSSGESELAAVVRAATKGLGSQSLLSDF